MADASVLFNAVLIESDEDPPELGAVLVPGRAQVSTPCSMIAQRSRALADPRCRPRRPTPPDEATFPPLEVLVARSRHQATELIITNTEIETQSTYEEKEQPYKDDATLRFQSERHRKPPVRRQVLETIVRSHGSELSDVNGLFVPFDSEDFPEKVRRPRQAMLAVDAVGRFQMTSR